ncbi:GIY-YIG nuclease family protein [Deinococcus kurensis]|uniref:GIY-YIG nuclease family protein n=1 Tax=Deinococcus kurensis TaxID=2662757 RepID=UPI0012D35907|nr:GIY-YIG nuclease family protein [Deinococcus kurensis]
MSAAPVVIPPAGVYAIQNTENGRVYVGASVDLERRIRGHKTQMKRGKSSNRNIQADLRELGTEVFAFSVLERVIHIRDLPAAEQRWASLLGAFDRERGYNIRGFTPSPETPLPAPAQASA